MKLFQSVLQFMSHAWRHMTADSSDKNHLGTDLDKQGKIVGFNFSQFGFFCLIILTECISDKIADSNQHGRNQVTVFRISRMTGDTI